MIEEKKKAKIMIHNNRLVSDEKGERGRGLFCVQFKKGVCQKMSLELHMIVKIFSENREIIFEKKRKLWPLICGIR